MISAQEPTAQPAKTSWIKNLQADLPASFVVFLVAVPLSLGIALASGAPIMAGLLAAVVGGIVVGALAGAPLQVSGPAAGLSVMVFGLVYQFGWAVTCAITVAAGLVQILLGSFRIARAALAISPAVVHGMLAGIGITIALSQLHIVLGDKPESSALNNLMALPQQIRDHHGPAVILGLITIAIMLIWPRLPNACRKVPAALVAVGTSTLVSILFHLHVERIDLPNNLLAGHVLPALPQGDQWGAVLIAVVSVALIASVESLLSAVATDKLHTGPRAHLDRELVAQGVGNTLSGLLGGLPVTGVVVRSSTNITAGAKSRASTMLHGLWILLFVTLLGSVIDQIPLATLAGLLVVVGFQLVNREHIRQLTHHREVTIYFATVAGVVFVNLLAGVGIGIGLAIFSLLRRLASVKVTVEEKAARPNAWHARIEGSLTFLSVPQVTSALGKIPTGTKVDIDLMVDLMDHAAFESLHGWRINHERLGGRVDIDERHENWYESASTGTPKTQKSAPLAAFATLLTGRSRRRRADATSSLPRAEQTSETLRDTVREFQRGADILRPTLQQLAREGQEPTALFITCADSRVLPNLLTLSGPGDLFQVRNVGNLVPLPDDDRDSSVGSAIEYALLALNVARIVVCGHSGCGAMHALAGGGAHFDTPVPHLGEWLTQGRASVARWRRGERFTPANAPNQTAADDLSQVNVIQQLEHLRAYPEVQRRVDKGTLELVGMFFDIENARVFLYDESKRCFASVEDLEKASVEEFATTAG